MSEESATRDVVELTLCLFETRTSDLDAHMRFYTPDAVFDVSEPGLGTFEGKAAIRSLLEGWMRTWDDCEVDVQEALDLGHGVAFVALWEDGRLVGSDGRVQQRRGWVLVWADDKVVRVTGYLDVDHARAAAARLAEERE